MAHTYKSADVVFFSYPSRTRNVNKTKFWILLANLCIRLIFCFFSLQVGLMVLVKKTGMVNFIIRGLVRIS